MAVSGTAIGLVANPYYALCLWIYVPGVTIIFLKFTKHIIKGVMAKMGMSHKLGAFTEEILSSMKLIISFGKEQKKL